MTNLDGKVALTVRDLLLHPGRLTREYLAGRRARYLPPVRLYLLASVAFFLVSAYEERVRPDGVRGGIVWRVDADSTRADSARKEDAADAAERRAGVRASAARDSAVRASARSSSSTSRS